jgi:LytR cell envelope-related transcriptional attenuator
MPLRPGRHAAGDGSFGRSAGMAAGRGAAVLVVAVVIGVLLLNKVDDPPARQVSTGGGDTAGTEETTTTVAEPVPTTIPIRPPGEVKVLSANGTRVNGAAGRVRDSLKAMGYNVLSPLETKQPVQASAVYFAPGFDREAQAVAQALKLPPTTVAPLPAAGALPVSDLRGANVLAVVGPELVRTTTTTTTRRTSTTARSRATSTSTSTSTTAPPPG